MSDTTATLISPDAVTALTARVARDSGLSRAEVMSEVLRGGIVTPQGFLEHGPLGFTRRPNCECVIGYVADFNCRACRGVGA